MARNIPSDSASIEVDVSGAPAGSYLRLSLSGTMNVSPLIRLRMMFDDWRRTHPCAGGDAGVIQDAAPRDASSLDASSGGASGSGGSGTAGGTGGSMGTDSGGCACRTSGRRAEPLAAWGLVMAAFGMARQRRRAN